MLPALFLGCCSSLDSAIWSAIVVSWSTLAWLFMCSCCVCSSDNAEPCRRPWLVIICVLGLLWLWPLFFIPYSIPSFCAECNAWVLWYTGSRCTFLSVCRRLQNKKGVYMYLYIYIYIYIYMYMLMHIRPILLTLFRSLWGRPGLSLAILWMTFGFLGFPLAAPFGAPLGSHWLISEVPLSALGYLWLDVGRAQGRSGCPGASSSFSQNLKPTCAKLILKQSTVFLLHVPADRTGPTCLAEMLAGSPARSPSATRARGVWITWASQRPQNSPFRGQPNYSANMPIPNSNLTCLPPGAFFWAAILEKVVVFLTKST